MGNRMRRAWNAAKHWARNVFKNKTPVLHEPANRMNDEEFRELFKIYVSALAHELGNCIPIIVLSTFRDPLANAAATRIQKALNDIFKIWQFVEKPVSIPQEYKGACDSDGHLQRHILENLLEGRISELRAALAQGYQMRGVLPTQKPNAVGVLERMTSTGTLLADMIDDLLKGRTAKVNSISINVWEAVICFSRSEILEATEPPDCKQIAQTPVICNPPYVMLIANNLLANARRALEIAGKPLIAHVSLEQKDGVMRIRLTDEGCGMPTEIMQRLNRGESVSTKPAKEPGVHGLGFQYCRQLTEKMGGKLYVEQSEPGKGTTVVLELRVASASLA